MKTHMTSILIVEDEESQAESLKFSLEKSGYRVNLATTGDEALSLLTPPYPDLMLLDLMLPGKDGFEVCRMVQRMEQAIPIIMTTAKGSETDRVVGLELGADDYVTKPFSIRELEARIKAVLRRKEKRPEEKQELFIDLERRILKRRDKMIDLSPKEWELLTFLARQDGKIVSKDNILDYVWGPDFEGDPRTVEIHIYLLRQKLEVEPSNPKHILTVKRMGYRFEVS